MIVTRWSSQKVHVVFDIQMVCVLPVFASDFLHRVINHVTLELNSLKNGVCVFVVKTPPCPSPVRFARRSEIMLILAISVISR